MSTATAEYQGVQMSERVANIVKRYRETLGDDGAPLSYRRFREWLAEAVSPEWQRAVPSFATLNNWETQTYTPVITWEYQKVIAHTRPGSSQAQFWAEIEAALNE